MINYFQVSPRLTAKDLAVLSSLSEPRLVNYSEIARKLGISRESVRKRIGKYQNLGYITCNQTNKGIYITPTENLPLEFNFKVPYIVLYWRAPADMTVGEMVTLSHLCKWQYFSRHKENMLVTEDGKVWVKHDVLAKQTGLTIDTIRKSIIKLKKRGFIQIYTAYGKGITKSFIKITKEGYNLVVNALTRKNKKIKKALEEQKNPLKSNKCGMVDTLSSLKSNTYASVSTIPPHPCQPNGITELKRNQKNNLSDYSFSELNLKITHRVMDFANALSITGSPTLDRPENFSFGENPDVTLIDKTPQPPYSPPFPADAVGDNISERRSNDMDKFEDMLGDIRERHKEKKAQTLTNAIAIYRSVIGDDEPLTPQEKNMLKGIMKYCKESNIELRRFFSTARYNWNKVRNKFGQVLEFAGYDVREPNIPTLYNHRVMKFIAQKVQEPQEVKKKVVKIKKVDEGVYVAIHEDGSGRPLTLEETERLKQKLREKRLKKEMSMNKEGKEEKVC